MPSDKSVVKAALKELANQGIKEFTKNQVIQAIPENLKNTKISSSWLIECIRSEGYVWNRDKKVWVYSSVENDLAIKEQMYQKTRTKLNRLEAKIRAILVELSMTSYCYGCKKTNTCKHSRSDKNLLSKFFKNDICKAHKTLIDRVSSLEKLLNQ